MSKEKEIGIRSEEIRISKPDERGVEIVLVNGDLYEKKTHIFNNCTANVYSPIPLKKKENK